MASISLSEINRVLNNNELDEILLSPPVPTPVVHEEPLNESPARDIINLVPPNSPIEIINLNDRIGQGIAQQDLAVDIGRIYLGMFKEYLVHRYGIHWPMTIYYRNGVPRYS